MEEQLQKLAKELRDAAQKYCTATGRTFEVHFSFVDASSIDGEKREVFVNVEVESTFSASA